MADREKIINNFEHEVNKAHGEGWDFVDLSTKDAKEILSLLKKQEPVKSKKVNRYMDLDEKGNPFIEKTTYDCGNCDKEFPLKAKYCPWCGKAVSGMDDCAMCGMKDGERVVLSPFAPSMCWLEVTKSGERIQMKFGYGDDDRDRIFYFPRYCPECGREVKWDEVD